MSEKVLREIQIIETDEGFRIEMKGDKEELRRMIFEQARPFFAWGQRFGGHGPFGHGPFGHQHEHGEQREHRHEHHEHHRPPFDFFFERHVEAEDEGEPHPHPEGRRFRGRNWKFKRGYDLGPWWDESAASPDEGMSTNA